MTQHEAMHEVLVNTRDVIRIIYQTDIVYTPYKHFYLEMIGLHNQIFDHICRPSPFII